MTDFYEDDEDPAAIRAAFDRGPHGVTGSGGARIVCGNVEYVTVGGFVESHKDCRAALDAAQDEIEKLISEIATLRAAGDSPGAGMIAEERSRQVIVEDYRREHDAKLGPVRLAMAAMAYLAQDRQWWPWRDGFKLSPDPNRDLTKAGALIAAAIDARLAERDSGGAS